LWRYYHAETGTFGTITTVSTVVENPPRFVGDPRRGLWLVDLPDVLAVALRIGSCRVDARLSFVLAATISGSALVFASPVPIVDNRLEVFLVVFSLTTLDPGAVVGVSLAFSPDGRR
jgi:hypothetical protein